MRQLAIQLINETILPSEGINVDSGRYGPVIEMMWKMTSGEKMPKKLDIPKFVNGFSWAALTDEQILNVLMFASRRFAIQR